MSEYEPKIVAFLCNWCTYAGADLAGTSRIQYPPNIKVIRVMCSGSIDPVYVMKPLLEGVADQLLESGATQDPKSQLQEWVQAKGNGAPTYRTVSASGPDHAKIFEVEVYVNGKKVGSGTGNSKQSAAKKAAREALSEFGID